MFTPLHFSSGKVSTRAFPCTRYLLLSFENSNHFIFDASQKLLLNRQLFRQKLDPNCSCEQVEIGFGTSAGSSLLKSQKVYHNDYLFEKTFIGNFSPGHVYFNLKTSTRSPRKVKVIMFSKKTFSIMFSNKSSQNVFLVM